MAMICTSITEWIEQEVSQPVEDWEESTSKKCKKHHWYDPRSWFCWLVYALVLVIRWVVVTVVTAVVTLVCNFVADGLSILWNSLKFLGNLLKALFTWDKCTLQEALGNLVDAVAGVLELVGDVVIRPFVDRVQTYRLRNWVSDEIDKRFGNDPQLAEAIKSNMNVATGVFGYKLTVTIERMFVDSETKTPESGDVPNLIYLHEAGKIDLYALAGFKKSCKIFSKEGWRHSIPRTGLKTWAGGGGGFGDTDPPEITRDDLDKYISSRGAEGPAFFIFSMSTSMLDDRIGAAEVKGRQLGLLLSFEKNFKEVTDHQYMNFRYFAINTTPIDCATKQKEQLDYLICELGRSPNAPFVCCSEDGTRTDLGGDDNAAHEDLCHPVAVAIFTYPDLSKSGFTNNLIGTSGYPHDLDASPASGLSFRAQIPKEIREYVLIHELGHYFGLTHVDGFDRIMVSGEEGQGSLLTWGAIPNSLIHGGPRFIYTEAQRVWTFVLTNFPVGCLAPGYAAQPPIIM